MSDKEVTQEATTTTATETEEGVKATVEAPESLTIQDLQGLANIIDLAARRGAFQARDMEVVGTSFNKLTGFLSHVAAKQQEAAEAREGTEEPSDDAAPKA